MDKKLLALIALFFISFGFFAALTIFNKPITNLTRAKEDSNPSPALSRMIAWPLEAPANGVAHAEISVFVVSESDKPLSNKVVTLTNSMGQLSTTAGTTDNHGKVTFQITSSTPGLAEIEAIVEPNIKLSRKVSVKFQ